MLAPVSKAKLRHRVVATIYLFVSFYSGALAQTPSGGGAAGGGAGGAAGGGAGGGNTPAQSSSNAGGTTNQNTPQQSGNAQNPKSAQQPNNAQNPNTVQQSGNAQNPNPAQQPNTAPQPGNAQNPNRQQPGNPQNPNIPQPSNAQNPTMQPPFGTPLVPNTPQQLGDSPNSNTRQQRVGTPQGTGGVEAVPGESFVGTVGSLTDFGFILNTSPGNPGSSFMLSPATVFIDGAGQPIPRERFSSETPVTVYYTQSGSEMIASRVVANEPPPVFSSGTTTEVSPGVIVIELPGSSPTSVRYVDNQTTNYVDQNGVRVNSETVKPGTPVKVFYTKIGDTFVASKVEVVTKDEQGGLPKPPLPAEPTTSTPERR